MSSPSEETGGRAVDAGLVSRKSGIASDFDRVARGYDRLNALNPGYSKHLRWSAERLGLEADARILDLCCGTGLSTAALRAAYPEAELTGMDASAGMLARAREKPVLKGLDLPAERGERRPQLVGDIGDELPAQSLRAFER